MMKLLSSLLIFSILSIDKLASSLDDKKKDIECSVTDGAYTFDLKKLQSELGYHLSEDNGHYSFNICKDLTRKCNNQTAAACFKNAASKEFAIGYTGTPQFDNGQIRIAYKGEKCDQTRNFTTNVILHCDYSPLKNDFLGVFPHTDQCEINIIMRTPVACLPLPEHVLNAKMIVTTPTNKTLNFKSLQTSNHEVENGTQFYIGFPILYGHNMMCEAGTSVCFVNTSATDSSRKYINMGSMTSNLKYENGNVLLKMTSNEICEKNKKFSSEIVFECDRLITGDGYPSFKGTSACVHRFVWPTSLACVDEKPCQLSTPDGQLYDFSSLHGVEYSAVNPKMPNKTIYFSICSPAKMCEGNVGSCVVQTISDYQRRITFAGNFNSTLQVDESKNLFLLYENGARCNAEGRKFTTKIEFIIADDEDDEVSVLVEDDCEIVIQFKTLLANANVKNCIAKTADDEEIDLSALIDYEGNYVAQVNEKALPNETSSRNVQYLLNVCRPLNSKYSLNCHGNTAACRTVIIDEKHEEELSLGHFEYSMSTERRREDNSTAVIMKYFKGSKCPSDLSEEILTEVKFFCNETAGLGNPILQSIEYCKYTFDFPTNILCQDRVISMKENSCELYNERLNVSVDMKPMRILGSEETPSRRVDICDNSTKRKFTVNYRQSMILIQYDEPSDKEHRRVEVQLKCSSNNRTMMVVNDDEMLVTNESVFVCPLLNIVPKPQQSSKHPLTADNSSEKKSDNDNSTTTGGFRMGYLFLVIILVVAFGAFYLVLRNPERREIIRNMIKFRSRSNNVRYSRVNPNEESVLLDNNHSRVLSDSEDDEILA